MPANDHVSPQQLKLFVSGTELRSMLNYSGDLTPGQGSYDQVHPAPGRPRIVHVPSTPRESMDSMWARKSAEAKSSRIGWVHGAGVYDSIATEGWRGGKLSVHDDGTRRQLVDGHHRVAAAADLEAEGRRTVWIPLDHR